MHIEILVEDSSGERLLGILLPKLLGEHGTPHTWRLHAYKGYREDSRQAAIEGRSVEADSTREPAATPARLW